MVPRPVLAVILLFPLEAAPSSRGAAPEAGKRRGSDSGSLPPVHIQVCTSRPEAVPAARCDPDCTQDATFPAAPDDFALQSLWYTKQTIGNACGTIAVLHALLNNTEDVALGESAVPGCFHSWLGVIKPEWNRGVAEPKPALQW